MPRISLDVSAASTTVGSNSTTTSWQGATSSTRRCRTASTHRHLIELMGRDKKALGGGLTFVLDGPRRRRSRHGCAGRGGQRGAPLDGGIVTTPRLTTARLLMREWRDGDRIPYAALNGDLDVMQHFPSTLTAQQSDEMIDRMIARWTDQGFGLWAVERLDTTEFIGFVGLAAPAWEASFTPCVEVGWRLGKQHWGQGFAPEAARAALAWGFEQRGSFPTTRSSASRPRRTSSRNGSWRRSG